MKNDSAVGVVLYANAQCCGELQFKSHAFIGKYDVVIDQGVVCAFAPPECIMSWTTDTEADKLKREVPL